jgi:hypothetical protein
MIEWLYRRSLGRNKVRCPTILFLRANPSIAALEALVESLRSHQERLEQSLQDRSFELEQCRREIEHQKETILDLRSQLSRAQDTVWNRESEERSQEILRLREEIARLERECIYLRGCVEKGLASIADGRTPLAHAAPSQTPSVSHAGATVGDKTAKDTMFIQVIFEAISFKVG